MDPIGLAGGLNLYGYANGDPINFSDPFGLCAQSKSSDTLETRYAHMSYTCVDDGEEVHAGQFLGYSGNTGTSTTGCHLHFETRVNGDVVDPMDILARHDVLTPTKRFVAAGLTSRFGKRRLLLGANLKTELFAGSAARRKTAAGRQVHQIGNRAGDHIQPFF